MHQGDYSAILLTFIKLPFVIRIFVISIFECPFYTGFTAHVFSFCFDEINIYGQSSMGRRIDWGLKDC